MLKILYSPCQLLRLLLLPVIHLLVLLLLLLFLFLFRFLLELPHLHLLLLAGWHAANNQVASYLI